MQVRQNHFFCWFFEIFSGVFFHFNRWWFHMYTPRIVRFSSPYLDALQIQTWRSSFLWLRNGKSWNISHISCRFQQLRVVNISVAKTHNRFISIVWLPDFFSKVLYLLMKLFGCNLKHRSWIFSTFNRLLLLVKCHTKDQLLKFE